MLTQAVYATGTELFASGATSAEQTPGGLLTFSASSQMLTPGGHVNMEPDKHSLERVTNNMAKQDSLKKINDPKNNATQNARPAAPAQMRRALNDRARMQQLKLMSSQSVLARNDARLDKYGILKQQDALKQKALQSSPQIRSLGGRRPTMAIGDLKVAETQPRQQPGARNRASLAGRLAIDAMKTAAKLDPLTAGLTTFVKSATASPAKLDANKEPAQILAFNAPQARRPVTQQARFNTMPIATRPQPGAGRPRQRLLAPAM